MLIVFSRKMRFNDTFIEELEKSKQKVERKEAKNSYLEIDYHPEYEPDDNPNKFYWNVTGVYNDTINVTLHFTHPELVSIGGTFDRVEIRLYPMGVMFYDF